MPVSPSVVVFDVNETLSDMAPIAERFTDVGAPEHLAKLWFASLLRDGFALTAAGTSEQFASLGKGALRVILAGDFLNRDMEDAVAHVMDGFAGLPLHPDVPEGVAALKATGRRLVTLTNGSTQVAERLLATAGLGEDFERLLSVEDAPAWKPAREAYAYAADTCGVDVTDMILVAVHPWDIDGASRAGMTTAWISRAGQPYPEYFTAPTYTVSALGELATLLDR